MAWLWLLSCFSIIGASFGCGVPVSHPKRRLTGRIINGMDALPKSWPWHLSLLDQDENAYCGGALISDKWVLTAAHCNPMKAKYFVSGHKVRPRRYVQFLEIGKVFSHPDFHNESIGNDIALVKLKRRVQLSQTLSPVCLPSARDNFPPGSVCVTTGMGYTDVNSTKQARQLQEAYIPILSNEHCWRTLWIDIPDNVLCAGGSGAVSTTGDAGGPVVCQRNRVWKLMGIVSVGSYYGRTDLPVLCSRVTSFLPWIYDIMAKN